MISSLTGPRLQINEFIRRVIGDLGIDGSDILHLVILLKERVIRDDLVYCLHNKGPQMHLSSVSFSHLSDILRAVLREANNVGDHKSISGVFRVSQLYGKTIGTYEYSMLSSLSSHEVWQNESYWFSATDALLSQYIFRWQSLSQTSRNGIFDSNFKEAQVRAYCST